MLRWNFLFICFVFMGSLIYSKFLMVQRRQLNSKLFENLVSCTFTNSYIHIIFDHSTHTNEFLYFILDLVFFSQLSFQSHFYRIS